MDKYLIDLLKNNLYLGEKVQNNMLNFFKHYVLCYNYWGDAYSKLQLKDWVGHKMTNDELAEFCKEHYKYLCAYYLSIKEEKPKVYQYAKQMFGDYVDSPDKISKDEAYNLLLSENGLPFEISEIDFQNPYNRQPEIDNTNRNKLVYDDFLHIHPFGDPRDNMGGAIDKRLYLDVSLENAQKIAIALFDYGLKDRRKVYLKINTIESRNDIMLIYVPQNRLEWYIKTLGEISKSHPEYFVSGGCELPFCAPIMKGVYLADEPKHIHSSFNRQVCNAINSCCRNNKDKIASCLKQVAEGEVVMPNGENLSMAKYLEKRLRIEYDKLLRESFNKADLLMPYEMKIYGVLYEDWLKNRNNSESEICQSLRNHAEKMVKDIQESRVSTLCAVVVKLNKFICEDGLSDAQKERKKNLFEKNGYSQIRVCLDYNPLEDIYNRCEVGVKLSKIINIDVITPFLLDEHISPNFPFLTTESLENMQFNIEK